MKLLLLFILALPTFAFSQKPNDITWEYSEVKYITAKIKPYNSNSKKKELERYLDSKVSMRGFAGKMNYITIDIPNTFYVSDATIYIMQYEENLLEGNKLTITGKDSNDKAFTAIIYYSEFLFEPKEIFIGFSDKTTSNELKYVSLTDFKKKD